MRGNLWTPGEPEVAEPSRQETQEFVQRVVTANALMNRQIEELKNALDQMTRAFAYVVDQKTEDSRVEIPFEVIEGDRRRIPQQTDVNEDEEKVVVEIVDATEGE